MKRIIVLGAGYGGILTAKKLAKKLKAKDVHITLIDRNPYHTLLTLLHEAAAGRIAEQALRIDLQTVFAGFKHVDVVLDNIVNVDFNTKQLQGTERVYDYDYLVIGTGSKPTFFNISGAEEYALTLWSYEDAVNIKAHVIEQFRLAMQEKDMQKRKQLLTFVIVGAGFTGVEMVGELAEYVQQLCREYYIERDEVSLNIVDMADIILPYLPKRLIAKAERRLEKLGVNIITGQAISAVTETAVHLNGQTINTHTVIWTAGIEGSDLVSDMDVEQEGRKRIVINDHLQIPEHREVYVVGDNMFFVPEGEERPVPQMVENAEQSAALIAHNIIATLKGKALKAYRPVFHGTMVCIGSRYGVAYVGIPKMMIPLSGFLAMFVKHFINMVYLAQVGGLRLVVDYIRHEFLKVEDNRSFIGGLVAERSSPIWLLPLRLLLGWMWLYIGWQAVIDALPEGHMLSGLTQHTGLAITMIILGALLIIGLFTVPVALILAISGVIMWMTGIANQPIIWYIIGSIALFSGAGHVLGLDYYVIPKLKAWWKQLPFVKRWYLYID